MKMEKRNNLLTMEKLLYIIIILLLCGCGKKYDINNKEYIDDPFEYAQYMWCARKYPGNMEGDTLRIYYLNISQAKDLRDIKEQLQILNSNIVELLNKK